MRLFAEATAAAGEEEEGEPAPWDWIAWSLVKTGAARSLAEADRMELEQALLWLAMEREARSGPAE